MDRPIETSPARIAVMAPAPAYETRARQLAAQLGLPLVPADRNVSREELLLIVSHEGLALQENLPRGATVRVDYRSGGTEHRRRHGGGLGQLIARAVGVGADFPRVVDATAGLGQDAFVLASLGCAVTAIERAPVLAAMIEDALAAAIARGSLEVRGSAGRMQIRCADAREYLAVLSEEQRPDVVYIDPMYPPKDKESALNRKEMRLCRALVGEDADAETLMAPALRAARRRVVVKRRREAPPLGGPPGIVYEEGGTRYDVYPTS